MSKAYVGELLARHLNGRTARWLAREADVAESTISRILSHSVSPSMAVRASIADVFGLTGAERVSWLEAPARPRGEP